MWTARIRAASCSCILRPARIPVGITLIITRRRTWFRLRLWRLPLPLWLLSLPLVRIPCTLLICWLPIDIASSVHIPCWHRGMRLSSLSLRRRIRRWSISAIVSVFVVATIGSFVGVLSSMGISGRWRVGVDAVLLLLQRCGFGFDASLLLLVLVVSVDEVAGGYDLETTEDDHGACLLMLFAFGSQSRGLSGAFAAAW